jgi:hypothetical protein
VSQVEVFQAGGEYVACAPDFLAHGFGATEVAARADLARCLDEQFRDLAACADAGHLAPRLQRIYDAMKQDGYPKAWQPVTSEGTR